MSVSDKVHVTISDTISVAARDTVGETVSVCH